MQDKIQKTRPKNDQPMAEKNKVITTKEKIVEVLLENRGIKSAKEKTEFFNPLNPQQISVKEFGIDQTELDKAIKRIGKAIENKDKIVVYGDYDVDGICATAILWETLDALGADATPFIPSRFVEGYGLSKVGVENLKLNVENCNLIITVDSGIVAYEGINAAKQLGVDVIITDHHEPGNKSLIDDVCAVVHTTKVSGSAVSWLLSRELLDNLKFKIENSKLEDHLGLVALGTIADVLPLVGLNRSIAVHGLKILRLTERAGFRALCLEATIIQKEIDTFHVGFVIAPRLNAMGRVEHAMESLRLICTTNTSRARDLASKLGSTNKLRQDKTEDVLAHVGSTFEPAWSDGNLPRILFVHHESYEEGVIGIAAGRLVDKYHRPSIVVTRGPEISKASVRSIPGINIVEILRSLDPEMFINLGGHPMAAGFTVKTQDLEKLEIKLQEISEKVVNDESLIKNVRLDMELPLDSVTWELHKELLKFAPFGYGNPEPTFSSKEVVVQNCRLIGKDSTHLKMVLVTENSLFDAIGFRMGEHYPNIKPNKKINIVYSIEENTWQGKRSLQLKLRQIKLS